MKKLKKSEYKNRKKLKQQIKSTPEKETDKPLLKSSVKMIRDPYGLDMGLMFPLLMFPLLMSSMLRRKRKKF